MERDLRVCEGYEGGKVFQTCEMMEEGGRKEVEVVVTEGLREE